MCIGDENQLQELPESICQLQYLEEIMVSHNDLHKLPSSIGLLRRLRILTCNYLYTLIFFYYLKFTFLI